ncbi:uncharacterized protein LOC131637258 [Vicia villosa]|uniref:uncharacterized protein LOC131637258 n=1 Tax=Vicia villosa TaxID=3911 RepID=UPI00273B7586|nr:uncharacterized protein LOC131637258 [Vicia villosa]
MLPAAEGGPPGPAYKDILRAHQAQLDHTQDLLPLCRQIADRCLGAIAEGFFPEGTAHRRVLEDMIRMTESAFMYRRHRGRTCGTLDARGRASRALGGLRGGDGAGGHGQDEMRKFLVPRTNIENINVVQPEAEVEETPPNVANEFNSYEIKDAAYCFYCFLFKPPGRAEHFGYEIFNKDEFKDWKHTSKGFKDHIGSHNSTHNSCMKHYDNYNNQRQSVTSIFARATTESEELYKIRLTCSLDCTRYLIAQGIAFGGHDESSTSLNKGNFREMVDWVKSNDEKVRDAFDRGPKNCTITSGEIQKELATCCAHEVTKVIMKELGERKFSMLIDESRDISIKEQMEVMLRLLNDKGKVVEQFIALYHVKYTTSEALKDAIYGILDRHTLSISRIRGQGYDGASNMRGEFNGLQRKILDEIPYAFYVHCYAHRLQLVVVSVASSCSSIHDFFEYISLIVTTTNASCKIRDALTEAEHQYILNRLKR